MVSPFAVLLEAACQISLSARMRSGECTLGMCVERSEADRHQFRYPQNVWDDLYGQPLQIRLAGERWFQAMQRRETPVDPWRWPDNMVAANFANMVVQQATAIRMGNRLPDNYVITISLPDSEQVRDAARKAETMLRERHHIILNWEVPGGDA